MVLALLVSVLRFSAFAGEHGQERAHAAHPPVFSLSNGITYTLGNHEHDAQLMGVHGLRFAAMLGGRVKWSMEGGAFALPTVAHSTMAVEFGPYVQTGPGVVITERVAVSAYIVWKLHGHEHLLGGTIAPTLGTPGGNVNVPIGVQCMVGEPASHCVATVSVKAAIDLRFQ